MYTPARLLRAAIRIPIRAFRKAQLVRDMRKRVDSVRIKTVDELNLLMDGHAYLHSTEIPLLARYAMTAQDTIVEIGCAFGASSAVLLSHAPATVTLHSIDPFIVDSMSTFAATQKSCERNVHRVLSALGLENRVADWQIRHDFSYVIAPTWTQPIDTLFIDGDHHYEAVRRDFDDWLPLVKTGGYILFHDSRKENNTPVETFNRGWTGPTQLAQELLSDSRVTLVDEAFSITVWKKNT